MSSKEKIKLGDVYKVVWIDSCIHEHQQYELEDGEFGIVTITTVGYLVAYNETFLTIAREVVDSNDEQTYRGCISIHLDSLVSISKSN